MGQVVQGENNKRKGGGREKRERNGGVVEGGKRKEEGEREREKDIWRCKARRVISGKIYLVVNRIKYCMQRKRRERREVKVGKGENEER